MKKSRMAAMLVIFSVMMCTSMTKEFDIPYRDIKPSKIRHLGIIMYGNR